MQVDGVVPGSDQQTYKDQFEQLLIDKAAAYYESEGNRLLSDGTLHEFANYVSSWTGLHGGPWLKSCCRKQEGLAVASIARDDSSPLPGIHRDHNALPSQTDGQTDTDIVA